jgi:hypothetical protein
LRKRNDTTAVTHGFGRLHDLTDGDRHRMIVSHRNPSFSPGLPMRRLSIRT